MRAIIPTSWVLRSSTFEEFWGRLFPVILGAALKFASMTVYLFIILYWCSYGEAEQSKCFSAMRRQTKSKGHLASCLDMHERKQYERLTDGEFSWNPQKSGMASSLPNEWCPTKIQCSLSYLDGLSLPSWEIKGQGTCNIRQLAKHLWVSRWLYFTEAK